MSDLEKGDYVGHPFRGNQYTDGVSGFASDLGLKEHRNSKMLGPKESLLSSKTMPRKHLPKEFSRIVAKLKSQGFEEISSSSLGASYKHRESGVRARVRSFSFLGEGSVLVDVKGISK